MDEVAGIVALTSDVGLEVSVDAVLHSAIKGFLQHVLEALQPVWVVGQTEFTRPNRVGQTQSSQTDHPPPPPRP